MDVNSVAVRVTVRTSGARNASALRTSRASVGLDGRGNRPVRGSRGGCEVIGRLSLPRHCTDVRGRMTFGKMTNPKPKAIALLSGGIDSTTALALAQRQGFEVYALTFRYGQRHEIEIAAARRIARSLHVSRHEVLEFDLRRFGGSALTDEIAVPKDRTPSELASGIPVTYVPARNTIFLSFALAWAGEGGAGDVFIGVTALDYSGYADCRPEYIAALQAMADLATRAGGGGRQGLP